MPAGTHCELGQLGTITDNEIVGRLTQFLAQRGYSTQERSQTDAWVWQLAFLRGTVERLLKEDLGARSWTLVLEFEPPRTQRRIDVVLLAPHVVFVIEFKVHATRFDRASRWQVEDYVRDLVDFHEGSRGRHIVPVVVATSASAPPQDCVAGQDARCVSSPDQLAETVLGEVSRSRVSPGEPLDAESWLQAGYRPTPTVIEAAEELFAGHSVTDISHAYADNLTVTAGTLIHAIVEARRESKRIVCFVTGVPGAGKTLAGLSAVHDPSLRAVGGAAGVFLSGNGPLVKVVREALRRDANRRRVQADARRSARVFIQNVHQFIREHADDNAPLPPEHVVVFDEAQRAWDAAHMAKKSEGRSAFSEAELVLRIMGRLPDWSVVIALVEGGQEIHAGEAGIAEWGRALQSSTTPWSVWASPAVLEGDASMAGHRLFDADSEGRCSTHSEASLHLSVNVRSPRAKRLTEWVEHVLGSRFREAKELSAHFADFPLVGFRDLPEARAWLRDRARSERRSGLLASSGALRLRAHGVEVSSGFRRGYPYEDWFLGETDDVRSSNALEVAATEFECQGLEIDWTCLCWGHDLCLNRESRWVPRRFSGRAWNTVRRFERITHVINRYRVLLTRARLGMAIWVPRENGADATRDSRQMDAVAAFLESCGVRFQHTDA